MKEPESGINYSKTGKGKNPVLLIHGFCESSTLWRDFTDNLSEYHYFLLPDLPGFGLSEGLPKGFTINTVAKQLKFWIDQIGISSCSVIGHSLGGYVALSLAQQYPESVNGLGLFHSTSFGDSAEKKENRLKAVSFIEKHGVKKFSESLIPTLFYQKKGLNDVITFQADEGALCHKETVIGYTYAMKNRPDLRNVLYRFNGKVLFIAGNQDKAVAPSDSIDQIRMLSNDSVAECIPDIGHMGMFENKQVTQSLVNRFLEIKS